MSLLGPALCRLWCLALLVLLAALVLAPPARAEPANAQDSAYTPERSEEGVGDVLRNYGMIFLVSFLAPSVYFWLRKPRHPSRAEKDAPLFVSFSYYRLAWLGAGAPAISIYGSVVLSILLHYEDVTSTHCNVPNPLPTISAAVGFGLPERWLFRFGILFMSSQRLLDGLLTYNAFRRELPHTQWFAFMARTHFWAHTLENLALFGLTYISSSEYYEYHEKSFVFWVLFQWIKLFLNMYLFRVARGPNFTPRDAKFWFYKKLLAGIDVGSFVVCLVTFVIHNAYCIPYMYALYSLAEYVLVLANILFNVTLLSMLPSELTFAVARTPHLLATHPS